MVLLSVPFPGSVYAAFRIAQAIKAHDPTIVTVLGGGFVNTELRELTEPRVFDYFDYVTLDDGERPLLALLEHLHGKRPATSLVRTFARVEGTVRYINCREPDIPFAEVGTPTWDGLPLDRYLSLLDMLNPMHRLWSDGRWNKLTVAHGCYWKKCSFCDVSLDYISRYDGAPAERAGRPHRGRSSPRPARPASTSSTRPRRPRRCKALADELQRRNRGDLVVGQHPLREVLHAGAVPAAGRQRLHRRLRRAGGGLRPAAEADEEGRLGRAGGAGDAAPSATPASWCTPT